MGQQEVVILMFMTTMHLGKHKEQVIEGLSAFLLVVLHHHKCRTSDMEVGKEYGESYK